MLLRMDFESEIPIYLQLKTQIIEGISIGNLLPGESLPSVRQLASDLGINLHTVNKTYTILKQDGFILVHRQKGVVVSPPDSGPKVTEEYSLQLKKDLRPIIAEALCRGMPEDEFAKICNEIYIKIKKKEL
jgi:GntR family transcriptional regulator